MRISRYEPWGLLNQLYQDLEKIYTQPNNSRDEDTTVATSAWVPAVDIKENEQGFIILADIPGVNPQEIEITMAAGILTIKGERQTESEAERKNYKRIERAYGIFHRRFSLPDTADAEKITATGKQGVLEIIIPKRPIAKTRKINVEC